MPVTSGKPIPELTKKQKERFFSLFKKRGRRPCWLWTGLAGYNGYGQITFNRTTISAHRISYGLATGKDLTGKTLLHSCHNPSCVNPNHLSIGTQSKNMQQAADLGITNKKLKPFQVQAIRQYYKNGMKPKDLAKVFKVRQQTIYDIIRYRTWKHLR